MQHNTDQRQAERQLVGNHLRRRAQPAHQTVFVVRRPAGQRDTINTNRSNAQHVKQRYVKTRNDQSDGPVGEWNMNRWPKRIDDHRHHRRGASNDWGQEINKARRLVGNDVFLQDKFQQIGKGLKAAAIADTIRSHAPLDESQHTTLPQHGVSRD